MTSNLNWTPGDLLRAGGVEALARQAAEQARTEVRQHWLVIIERWAADPALADDLLLSLVLANEARRLRKALGLPPPALSPEALERRRERTRERVRRHRQRRRATIELGGGGA
jgi:hypothetical protein